MESQEALKRIRREAGTPYFSTLYDIDMWREDFKTIERDLKILEIITNSIVIENKPFKLREKNADESYISYCLSQSYEIHQYNLNEKLRKALTQWIINNIDKEKVKEWLKEDLKCQQIEKE